MAVEAHILHAQIQSLYQAHTRAGKEASQQPPDISCNVIRQLGDLLLGKHHGDPLALTRPAYFWVYLVSCGTHAASPRPPGARANRENGLLAWSALLQLHAKA
jgi:hypothetical protein